MSDTAPKSSPEYVAIAYAGLLAGPGGCRRYAAGHMAHQIQLSRSVKAFNAGQGVACYLVNAEVVVEGGCSASKITLRRRSGETIELMHHRRECAEALTAAAADGFADPFAWDPTHETLFALTDVGRELLDGGGIAVAPPTQFQWCTHIATPSSKEVGP
ncbi:MAG TPA: hypothetical protein DHW34_01745 [Actinobacteria bacterium]|nr:hypothetical protein [Actinomycetota bacterium]HCK78719.1 hypothetical protein [Actinomycetota bacterium]